jgi:hypothetical protein
VDDVGSPAPRDAYRLGDGLLELESGDESLRGRFDDTYAECRVPAGASVPGPTVRCVVRPDGPSTVRVDFDDPVPTAHAASAHG